MAMIRTLMVSCQKATGLLERREFRTLGMGERVGLWFHLRICDGCRRYERQSAMVDELLKRRLAEVQDTRDLEARILDQLGS